MMFAPKSRTVSVAIFATALLATMFLQTRESGSWDAYLNGMFKRSTEKHISARGALKHAPGHEYYYMSRMYGSPGVNVDQKLLQAIETVDMRENAGFDKTTMSNTWESIGPANIAGRVRALAFDPTNPDIVYAGGASGGVFKSVQGGKSGSWVPVMDFADAIPTGAIAVDPQNPNIVYAGTGEPTMMISNAYSAPLFTGVGIMKSEDAGQTWRLLPWLSSSSAVHQIRIDPTNSSHIIVADRAGIYRTTDAGQTWDRVRTGVTTDLAFKYGSPNVVFATTGYDNGSVQNGFYMSTESGAKYTWTRIDQNWPRSDSTGRIVLAATPADPNFLLAFVSAAYDLQIVRNGFDFLCLMRSTDGGNSWERLRTDLLGNYTNGQAFYDFCAVISPTDKNIVLTGGLDLFRSTNGGLNFTQITDSRTVHVDQHVLAYTPNNQILFAANDGGVYQSSNNGLSWADQGRTLETIQFYSLAYDRNDADRFWGGVQDHGIFQLIDKPNKRWVIRRGGDGGYVLVDPKNSSLIYSRMMIDAGGESAVPARSTNGGSTWTRLDRGFGAGGEYDRFMWLTPMMLHSTDNTRMYVASHKVYTASNIGTDASPLWTAVSPDLTRRSGATSGITTLGMCENNHQYMYTGSGDGKVFVTKSLLALDNEWTDITGGLPNRWVSRVKVDYNDPETAYVVFSGYGASHVFFTTDAGTNWTDISGDLPDIPVNAIALSRSNSKVIFIGTDYGVWYTYDKAHWQRFGGSLPNVAIYDLDVDARGRLIAATFGRGMWVTAEEVNSVAPARPQAFALLQNYPNPVVGSVAEATQISYSLENSMDVTLNVHDVSGRVVAKLVNGRVPAGSHSVRFDARALTPGMYFYTLSDGVNAVTKKMVVVR